MHVRLPYGAQLGLVWLCPQLLLLVSDEQLTCLWDRRAAAALLHFPAAQEQEQISSRPERKKQGTNKPVFNLSFAMVKQRRVRARSCCAAVAPFCSRRGPVKVRRTNSQNMTLRSVTSRFKKTTGWILPSCKLSNNQTKKKS